MGNVGPQVLGRVGGEGADVNDDTLPGVQGGRYSGSPQGQLGGEAWVGSPEPRQEQVLISLAAVSGGGSRQLGDPEPTGQPGSHPPWSLVKSSSSVALHRAQAWCGPQPWRRTPAAGPSWRPWLLRPG